MPKKRFHHVPLLSTRVTATVSVALVLVILGIASLVGCATHVLSQSVRDNLGFVVIFEHDVTAGDISAVTDRLKASGGIKSTSYSSADQILERWQRLVGEDEDILSLAGVNPFSSELEVHVNDAYASHDSILSLASPLALLPQVYDVKVHSELIDNVNSSLKSVSLILVGVAVALLIVSFVLIFNTVRLSVYARRFLINTMQLVGATSGFIRRPFMCESLVIGAVAGLIASVVIALAMLGCLRLETQLSAYVGWADVFMVIIGMIVAGMVICLIAAWMACNRYLTLSYDELYK